MCGVGFFVAFICSQVLPDIIESIELAQKVKDPAFLKDLSISDKASALYNMTFAIGSIIAPMLGGGLEDLVGYIATTEILAVFESVYCILFLMFVTVPFYYSRRN